MDIRPSKSPMILTWLSIIGKAVLIALVWYSLLIYPMIKGYSVDVPYVKFFIGFLFTCAAVFFVYTDALILKRYYRDK